MKKIISLFITIFLAGCFNCSVNKSEMIAADTIQMRSQKDSKAINKPYEATWMRISQTDSGYVVYDYPALWNDEASKSPEKIIIKDSIFLWRVYSDPDRIKKFKPVELCDDGTYFFKFGNLYRFKIIDKEKHIAQWIIYSGYEENVQSSYYYVDSAYNTYPIVDFEWVVPMDYIPN
jgi:hypothetical protein